MYCHRGLWFARRSVSLVGYSMYLIRQYEAGIQEVFLVERPYNELCEIARKVQQSLRILSCGIDKDGNVDWVEDFLDVLCPPEQEKHTIEAVYIHYSGVRPSLSREGLKIVLVKY